MDKRLVGIGLIGAIIVLVGVFTPWVTASGENPFTGEEFSESTSGWELTEGVTREVAGQETTIVEGKNYPYLALAGGVIALVGAIGALAAPEMNIKIFAVLFAIGGVLTLIGVTMGYLDIQDVQEGLPDIISLSIGYGGYLSLIGGIISFAGAYGTIEGDLEISM